MNKEQLLSLIDAQYVSEKSTNLTGKHNQYVFKVNKKATKPQLRLAIEKLFNVKVEAVTIVNVKEKTRRFGQIQGKKKGWKKAYVSVAEGQSIELPVTQG